jgi:uncharacterized protein
MRDLRRMDRTLDLEASRQMLEAAPVGRMATVGPDGPYITPLSFVYVRPASVYFHCAEVGHKLDNLAHDPRVCFEVDACEGVVHAQRASQCTVKYGSVLCFGQARTVDDREEKARSLDLLVRKYATVDYPALTDEELDGVVVIAIDITSISGKSNQ